MPYNGIVYDFVQGYEAMHFLKAVEMIREINLILTTTPCMNYTRGYKTFLSNGTIDR